MWDSTDASVDHNALTKRQIRLYIENAPVFFPLAVVVGVTLVAAGVWQFLSAEHFMLLLWVALIVATCIVRWLAWAAFARADPTDDALGPWLKWFLVPQICTLSLIGAGPIFVLPVSSGQDMEV